MRARDAYRLIVRRGGPRIFAPADRVDHVEIVAIDEGEVLFYWDLPPRGARRLARALREDLSTMTDDEFVAAWEAAAEQGREL
jgi:hypothetical protein